MQMPSFFEIVKILVIALVEGVTEWLPVSSSGHMLLVDAFLPLKASAEFKSLFFIVIQLAAVCAVIVLFWNDMFPFRFGKENIKEKNVVQKDIFVLWFKTLIACIPGAAAVFLFGDFIEAHLQTPAVISCALIFYGILFIVVERINEKRSARIGQLSAIDYKTAFIIGLFQVLSIIPGTSRSGATIIGALLIGVSRKAAASFTFFFGRSRYARFKFVKTLKIRRLPQRKRSVPLTDRLRRIFCRFACCCEVFNELY